MLHVIRPQLGQFYSRQLSCPAVFASQEANAEPAAEFTAPQGELGSQPSAAARQRAERSASAERIAARESMPTQAVRGALIAS